MSKIKDLTGQKFGKLTVIERAEDYISQKGQHQLRWRCKCDCGSADNIIINGTSLKNGKTKSCGCLNKELLSQRSKKYNQYDLSNDYGIIYVYSKK